MLKKILPLAGILFLASACVITSPAGLFLPTPTICVECVQATICAEDASGNACLANTTPTPAEILPTLIQDTGTPTETPTNAPTPTEPGAEETLRVRQLSATPAFTNTAIDLSTEQPAAETEQVVQATPAAAKTNALKTIVPPVLPAISSTVKPGVWMYKAQTGSPKYAKNFAHPESACTWSGIAGQVFGPGGAPQTDIVVVVNGEANGAPVDLLGFTGSAAAYGAGAYEVEFPAGPIQTKDTIRIQLFDLAGKELSDALPFDTYSECSKNLIVFNFVLAK
jgi:hypothetical protein